MHTRRFGRGVVRIVVAAVAAIALFLPGPATVAQATEWRTGAEVIVEAGDTVEGDLYVNTDSLVIEGTVQGDVFGRAYHALIEGAVEGDVTLVGQEVTVTGVIDDDLRTAAISLRIVDGGQIKGAVTGAGFSLRLDKKSAVGGDLWYLGYQADLTGDVGGAVAFDGAALALGGAVGGDVDARLGAYRLAGWPFRFDLPTETLALPPGLAVGEGASVRGDLVYTSPAPYTFDEAAVKGRVTYTTLDEYVPLGVVGSAFAVATTLEQQGWATTLALGWLVLLISRLLTFLIVGVIAVWRMPRLLRVAAEQLRRRALPSVFLGLALVLLTPFALAAVAVVVAVLVSLLTVLTVGGLGPAAVAVGVLGLGALTTAAFVTFTLVAPEVVAFRIGAGAVQRLTRAVRPNRAAAMLLGVVIYVFVWQIPVFGECFNCISILFGVGALFFYWRSRGKEVEPEPAVDLWAPEPPTPEETPAEPAAAPLEPPQMDAPGVLAEGVETGAPVIGAAGSDAEAPEEAQSDTPDEGDTNGGTARPL